MAGSNGMANGSAMANANPTPGTAANCAPATGAMGH
jgi:hypothetical protein